MQGFGDHRVKRELVSKRRHFKEMGYWGIECWGGRGQGEKYVWVGVKQDVVDETIRRWKVEGKNFRMLRKDVGEGGTGGKRLCGERMLEMGC